jgi:hypothetical protein
MQISPYLYSLSIYIYSIYIYIYLYLSISIYMLSLCLSAQRGRRAGSASLSLSLSAALPTALHLRSFLTQEQGQADKYSSRADQIVEGETDSPALYASEYKAGFDGGQK